jgi:hypothetical protein
MIIALHIQLSVETCAQMCIEILTLRCGANEGKCLQNVTALSFDYMNQQLGHNAWQSIQRIYIE